MALVGGKRLEPRFSLRRWSLCRWSSVELVSLPLQEHLQKKKNYFGTGLLEISLVRPLVLEGKRSRDLAELWRRKIKARQKYRNVH